MNTKTNSKNTGKEICECGHLREDHDYGVCEFISMNGHVDNKEICRCNDFKKDKEANTGRGSIKGLMTASTTSEQLYEVREMEIAKEIKALKQVLKLHKERFLEDSKNYGYAGDLGSILDYLRNITEQF